MNPKLTSALMYAQYHFKVFPLKVNSKSGQVLKSWKEEATTDQDTIMNWFSNTDYNVGVRTGNGLLVIDVDNKNGKNGYQSIEPFLNNFPKTLVVKTANNGWHMYYYVDRPISCKVGLYEAIDIRGEGGYVVGAESVIENKKYFISFDSPIAHANDAVYQFLEKNTKPTKVDSMVYYIHEGERNNYLFKIGCFLQQKGLCDEAIRLCLNKENELRCKPPFSDKEVETIIQSSLKYKKGFIEMKNTMHYEGSYTVTELLDSQEDDEPDIVEDMISVGLTLLGAPQKCGKTFLGLQLSDAIATGKDFLGRKVEKGTALYLAFEDRKTKIKKRLRTMQVEKQDNFIIDILKQDFNYDVESRIQEELKRHSDLKIVIIDTFAKIRKKNDREYESEYKEATFYHELACKYNIAIVLITHVKKEIDTNHPFDGIYGSRGLMAGSDSILVMYKKNHLSKNRQLAIQGKDIPDDELTLHLNERQLLEVVENEIEEDVNENLIKVVNYIVKEKNYVGSHEALCSKLSLPLTSKGLQVLLTSNIDTLQSTFISYEKAERKNKARQMKLTYHGEEED